MINTVLFDMDGLLIDSEPFWKEAEIKIFRSVGVELNEEMCNEMQGVKIKDVIQIWSEKLKWKGKTNKQLEFEIIEYVKKLIDNKGALMSGAEETLNIFKQNKYKIGLASSSSMDIIDKVVDKLKIREYFDYIHSAQFEKKGKPYPDVFLGAAKKLQSKPQNCIVFEDAYYGVLAAKRAGMKVIAIPPNYAFKDSKYNLADMKLKSLKNFNMDIINLI